MEPGVSLKRQARFQFVIDELLPIRPRVKQAFGFTYLYVGERLVLSLRDQVKQPKYNGVWLYTGAEHIDHYRREFQSLPRRCFWRSKKSGTGWVIIAAEFAEFEEYAFKACELILNGDRRIGRPSRSTGRVVTREP
jgi:hypothetical protein